MYHAMYISSDWFSAKLCLASIIAKQNFLLNRFMKLAPDEDSDNDSDSDSDRNNDKNKTVYLEAITEQFLKCTSSKTI